MGFNDMIRDRDVIRNSKLTIKTYLSLWVSSRRRPILVEHLPTLFSSRRRPILVEHPSILFSSCRRPILVEHPSTLFSSCRCPILVEHPSTMFSLLQFGRSLYNYRLTANQGCVTVMLISLPRMCHYYAYLLEKGLSLLGLPTC